MTGYLEVCVRDKSNPQAGLSAFIDVGSVYGVVAAQGLKAWDASTSTKPLMVFFRASAELEIYGPSIAELLATCERIRISARDNPGRTTIVCRDDYICQTSRSLDGNGFDIQVRYVGSNLDVEPVTPQP